MALEALDVELSLDYFGTGYSSMFMLKRLPVSEIKVDQSFVSKLTRGGEDASIVRSIIELAHGLGLQAVAEGVETEEVWDQLVGLGCDTAQGWFVSRPMPAAAATDWLRGHFRETDHSRSRSEERAPEMLPRALPRALPEVLPEVLPLPVAAEAGPA